MYQFEKDFDFHALGREIKRKRKNKGWTQEYLAQLLDRTPRSIMYMENRGQHPSLNVLFKIATLLEISIDQFFFPAKFLCGRGQHCAQYGERPGVVKAPSRLLR